MRNTHTNSSSPKLAFLIRLLGRLPRPWSVVSEVTQSSCKFLSLGATSMSMVIVDELESSSMRCSTLEHRRVVATGCPERSWKHTCMRRQASAANTWHGKKGTHLGRDDCSVIQCLQSADGQQGLQCGLSCEQLIDVCGIIMNGSCSNNQHPAAEEGSIP